MNANQVAEAFRICFMVAYIHVQQLAEQIGGFQLDEFFAAPIAAFHLHCAIVAVTNQMPLPPQHGEKPEPVDGYVFDEDVAIEVDIDVDSNEELDISSTRYLDPTEEDDVEIDVEGSTPIHPERSQSSLSTAIEYYDKYAMYMSPTVPIMGYYEPMGWQAAEGFYGPAPVQQMEVEPAPGVPVLEIEEVRQAFHEDFGYPESPVEMLPRMDIEDVPVENQAGKIKRPRMYRTRHNPMERPGAPTNLARRKLHF